MFQPFPWKSDTPAVILSLLPPALPPNKIQAGWPLGAADLRASRDPASSSGLNGKPQPYHRWPGPVWICICRTASGCGSLSPPAAHSNGHAPNSTCQHKTLPSWVGGAEAILGGVIDHHLLYIQLINVDDSRGKKLILQFVDGLKWKNGIWALSVRVIAKVRQSTGVISDWKLNFMIRNL